ncbi:ATP-binding cassette domain-containing protein [Ktedonosporobacter rubrisoli]|uniref:ATP-binding cassette domain-containing protein n=1 Tax=Ktedonosporobacter rubrisoli TaxID=2509675 RepID=A0A4P6K0X5_KTERU|nr:ATP-binding cassette domain-containing protein [Ktedonosporobacter rubrisoli]QBD81076.1 ATP-binding cassette domain-containing protein [Ktedonosporobacter rubrisoli]
MLEIRHLEKIVDGRSMLSIDELKVEAGEVVAVIGPVGAGKTLLISILAGALPRSGGSVSFAGKELSACAQRPGVLLAEDLLYERLSVEQNLAFYAQVYGVTAARVSEMLAQVGLSDQVQQTVSKLTPSALRRLAFARALLPRPRLLLLDQPTLRSDLETQELMARLLRQTAREGAAILLTDEDLAWAGACCTCA